jgi:molybdopterin-guanine dinucleotide biosynthesis protein A
MGCDQGLLPSGGGRRVESVARAAVVSVPELTPFQDVNTPEERAAYAAK